MIESGWKIAEIVRFIAHNLSTPKNPITISLSKIKYEVIYIK